jgi:hypothetical protein
MNRRNILYNVGRALQWYARSRVERENPNCTPVRALNADLAANRVSGILSMLRFFDRELHDRVFWLDYAIRNDPEIRALCASPVWINVGLRELDELYETTEW